MTNGLDNFLGLQYHIFFGFFWIKILGPNEFQENKIFLKIPGGPVGI